MKFNLLLLLFAFKLAAMDIPNSIPSSIPMIGFEFRNIEHELQQACKKSHNDIIFNKNKTAATQHLCKLIKGFHLGFGRAFNWSIAEFKDGYILAVRVACSKDEKQKIIPGNGPDCPYEQGSNFWWVDIWDSNKFYGGTLFFCCNKRLQNFSLVFPLNPIAKMEYAEDLRLMNDGMRLFAYIPNKLELAFEITDIISPFKDGFFVIGNIITNHRLKNMPQSDARNWAMLECNDQYCHYLDWFYLDGVRLIKTQNRTGTSECSFIQYCSDNEGLKYTIYGKGSAQQNYDQHLAGHNYMVMPWFSFGTPHVKVNNNYLGVGHIKIWLTEEATYKENSNIALFRKNINEYLHTKFGNKYIRHYNFIYMMFFYRVNFNQNGTVEMTISDAFLPENTSMEYTFSVIFPMGICLSPNKDKLFVSGGYGDFYPVLMQFSVEQVEELAKKHSMKQVDMHNFEYKLMNQH